MPVDQPPDDGAEHSLHLARGPFACTAISPVSWSKYCRSPAFWNTSSTSLCMHAPRLPAHRRDQLWKLPGPIVGHVRRGVRYPWIPPPARPNPEELTELTSSGWACQTQS
jgi:hypothetical protein